MSKVSKISVKIIAASAGAELGLSKHASEAFAKKLFAGIAGAVMEDNAQVSVNEFGTFKRRDSEARQGRNPATGEPITIAASQTCVFKASTCLKISQM